MALEGGWVTGEQASWIEDEKAVLESASGCPSPVWAEWTCHLPVQLSGRVHHGHQPAN